jgi:hypothetical protein
VESMLGEGTEMIIRLPDNNPLQNVLTITS